MFLPFVAVVGVCATACSPELDATHARVTMVVAPGGQDEDLAESERVQVFELELVALAEIEGASWTLPAGTTFPVEPSGNLFELDSVAVPASPCLDSLRVALLVSASRCEQGLVGETRCAAGGSPAMLCPAHGKADHGVWALAETGVPLCPGDDVFLLLALSFDARSCEGAPAGSPSLAPRLEVEVRYENE